MTAPAISWLELIVLMAMGPGDGRADTVRGLVHTRDTWQVHGEAPADQETVEHPTLGVLGVAESTERVLRKGELVRLERPGGGVTAILGADTAWTFGDGEAPVAHGRQGSYLNWAVELVVWRPQPSRWEGDDFTRLTGPIEATEVLGRPAWAFELAPPPHKPFPVQMIVDAASGVVLRTGNRDFGSVSEWLEIEIGPDLPDELFTWDGPTRTPEDRRAEHEREVAERAGWLAEHGVAMLPLAAEPELFLHERDDGTGAFHLSFDVRRHGALLRRPTSDEQWSDADGLRYPYTQRWSDERWDWCLASTEAFSDPDLERLKEHLGHST